MAENIQNESHKGELIQPPEDARSTGVAVAVTIAAVHCPDSHRRGSSAVPIAGAHRSSRAIRAQRHRLRRRGERAGAWRADDAAGPVVDSCGVIARRRALHGDFERLYGREMEVKLASSRGFCFGVEDAIEIAEAAVEQHGAGQVVALGPVIHNKQVVSKLEKVGCCHCR